MKIIDVEIDIKHETEKAILVTNLKDEDIWIPKSQVEIYDEGITLPEWLAIRKELI